MGKLFRRFCSLACRQRAYRQQAGGRVAIKFAPLALLDERAGLRSHQTISATATMIATITMKEPPAGGFSIQT